LAKPAGDTKKSGPSEPATNWRSKIDVGFNWQNGSKDKQDISLRFESRRKIGKSDYRFQTRYLLAKTNGTTSADSLDAGLRWRRDFNDRWFTQTNTTYYDDGVREIDLNVDQNAGFGYRILTGDLAKANLGAGVTVQYRQAAGVDEGVAKFGEFFQDLVWRFHDRFEFSQEASARFSPDERPLGLPSSGTQVASGVPNYRLVFESVVRGQITETMTVNLRYEFKFDNAIANRDARADQRITTGLGYAF
jgi:putative salt-induced outer membrane protein YdiY